MLAVVVSRADEASVHIGDHLLDLADWSESADGSRPDADGGGTVYRLAGDAGDAGEGTGGDTTEPVELREFDRLHLDLERPADAFGEPELLVFVSRHSGETGPLLTAHHTGNVGPADHGGEPNRFARACPNAHARVLDALAARAPEGYEVGMECTHHGPTDVGAPSMFVEVGSGPEEWADPDAAQAVARAVLDLRSVPADREPERSAGGTDPEADRETDKTRRHLLGVGGGHYAPRFERVVRETDWAVGHVAAGWGLDLLAEDEYRPVVERLLAESRAAYALLEGERPEAAAAVEAAGGRVVGETWVRETDGVPLPFVRAVESAVATVGEGLRFGDLAHEDGGASGEWRAGDNNGGPPAFAVADLPPDLLAEARGIDREATREVLAARTLAFVTDQGGTRPTGPAVLRTPEAYEGIVDGLVDVLETQYSAVTRRANEDHDTGGPDGDGEMIIARETAFDPEKARTLGVPEGPKFGKLADGKGVEVDGERIPPEAVRTEREVAFSISKTVRRPSDDGEIS
ncbi:MAG: D-aminoacyl-tRNA deacylase [Haloarculaceae archaeon]